MAQLGAVARGLAAGDDDGDGLNSYLEFTAARHRRRYWTVVASIRTTYISAMQSERSLERFKLMATLWGIYCRASKAGGWLSYHFQRYPATPFGTDLLEALAICEEKVKGLGLKLAKELAAVRFVRNDGRSYEQFIQKLAEIAAIRALIDLPWPDRAKFQHEPKAPNGKRPELSIETDDALHLFEVKCASMIEHQKTRLANPGQFPARTLPAEALPGMAQVFEGRVTLPRDYPMAEFLMSANDKFSSFKSKKPIFGALIVVWDNHTYEAVSPLTHEMSGLLTPRSWKKDADGARLPFASVDGVMLLNHFNVLTRATREEPPLHRANAFKFDDEQSPPNVWCANMGGKLPPDILMAAFDAVPVEAMESAADYKALDVVMWMNVGQQPNGGADG